MDKEDYCHGGVDDDDDSDDERDYDDDCGECYNYAGGDDDLDDDDDNDDDDDDDDDNDDADDDADDKYDDDNNIPPGCKCNRAEGWIHSNLQCLRMTEGWEYRQSPDCYDFHYRDFDDFLS